MNALLALLLAAATIDGQHEDAAYLEYGKAFADHTVEVRSDTAAGTGVLIADHWALTAAHVVSGQTGIKVDGKITDRVVVCGEWNHGSFNRNDIALVRTFSSHSRASYPPLADGGESVGDRVSLAGYGMTGLIGDDKRHSDGKLRAGTQLIDRLDDEAIFCTLQAGSSPLEFGIAPGDSGGPMFLRGRVAGIHSALITRRSRDGDAITRESVHTRVSRHAGWIRSVLSSDSVARQATETIGYK